MSKLQWLKQLKQHYYLTITINIGPHSPQLFCNSITAGWGFLCAWKPLPRDSEQRRDTWQNLSWASHRPLPVPCPTVRHGRMVLLQIPHEDGYSRSCCSVLIQSVLLFILMDASVLLNRLYKIFSPSGGLLPVWPGLLWQKTTHCESWMWFCCTNCV